MPLAHAGGIDELLYILLPFAIFFVVLEMRRRRYSRRDEPTDKPPDE